MATALEVVADVVTGGRTDEPHPRMRRGTSFVEGGPRSQFDDRLGPRICVASVIAFCRPLVVLGNMPEFPEKQHQCLTIMQSQRDVRVDQFIQGVAGIEPLRPLDGTPQELPNPIKDGEEDLVLAGEIPVESRSGDSGSCTDLIDGRRVKTLDVEQAGSCIDDLLTAFPTPFGRRFLRTGVAGFHSHFLVELGAGRQAGTQWVVLLDANRFGEQLPLVVDATKHQGRTLCTLEVQMGVVLPGEPGSAEYLNRV